MDIHELSMQTSGMMPVRSSSPPQISVHSAADILQAIHRQTTYLQREIQYLLDAQSVGLLAGLGQTAEPYNDGTYAPGPINLPLSPRTEQSSLSPTLPVRKAKRRPSLATSRNQLHSSMVQLAELKNGESTAIEVQHDVLTNFLANVTALREKQAKIKSSLQSIDTQNEGAEENLVEEEKALVSEITTLERQLETANAKLKHIRRQRQEGNNRRTARLSSWQGALDDVDRKIDREVLTGQGLEDIISNRQGRRTKSKDIGIWNLPRERRTVELVQDDITARVKNLEERRDAAERESLACHEGAEMWASSIARIEELEETMAKEMARLASDKMNHPNQLDGQTCMIQIVDNMTETIGYLEHELDIAEVKGWNLLVCAIGAEVEALRQGQDLLQQTLQMNRDESTPGTSSMMTAKSRMASDLTDGDQARSQLIGGVNGSKTAVAHAGVDPLGVLEQSPQHKEFRYSQAKVSENKDYDEDNDDAPGPELLIEHDIS